MFCSSPGSECCGLDGFTQFIGSEGFKVTFIITSQEWTHYQAWLPRSQIFYIRSNISPQELFVHEIFSVLEYFTCWENSWLKLVEIYQSLQIKHLNSWSTFKGSGSPQKTLKLSENQNKYLNTLICVPCQIPKNPVQSRDIPESCRGLPRLD